MPSDFYIARLVLVEQQGLCKVFTAPRSNRIGSSLAIGEVRREAAMDVALKTPVEEGRQGADSEKRPAEVRRSDPEPHFWEISGSRLGLAYSRVEAAADARRGG